MTDEIERAITDALTDLEAAGVLGPPVEEGGDLDAMTREERIERVKDSLRNGSTSHQLLVFEQLWQRADSVFDLLDTVEHCANEYGVNLFRVADEHRNRLRISFPELPESALQRYDR
jgi:hypothetical protein